MDRMLYKVDIEFMYQEVERGHFMISKCATQCIITEKQLFGSLRITTYILGAMYL